MSELDLSFRPMEADDLPLLHEWLLRPHVRRWYGERGSYGDVVARYLPAIEGSDRTDHYVVHLDGRPVGMVQTYLVVDHPEYADLIGIDECGTAGVDILIGEPALTGQGLGTEILKRFIADVVFARPGTTSCVADPDVANLASLRVFEKAGFEVVREFVDPGDGQTHALVRLEPRHAHGAHSAPR